MSTLSSLVLASSSTLTLDMIKGHIIKNMDDKKQVFIMRVLIVIFIVISAFIAINKDKLGYIADMMGISWGALSGAFLPPFLYGLYWKGTNKWGVLAGFVSGIGIVTANMLLNNVVEASVAGALAMFAGLIVVPVVSLITPKPEKKLVEDCFACYDSKVEVQAKYALGEEEK
jgi:SSS family solute:Na+ symporter